MDGGIQQSQGVNINHVASVQLGLAESSTEIFSLIVSLNSPRMSACEVVITDSATFPMCSLISLSQPTLQVVAACLELGILGYLIFT